MSAFFRFLRRSENDLRLALIARRLRRFPEEVASHAAAAALLCRGERLGEAEEHLEKVLQKSEDGKKWGVRMLFFFQKRGLDGCGCWYISLEAPLAFGNDYT